MSRTLADVNEVLADLDYKAEILNDGTIAFYDYEGEQVEGKLFLTVESAYDGAIKLYEVEADEEPPYDMTDVEADADALRNIGWGTDEDYGYYPDDFF